MSYNFICSIQGEACLCCLYYQQPTLAIYFCMRLHVKLLSKYTKCARIRSYLFSINIHFIQICMQLHYRACKG